jgi:integrase
MALDPVATVGEAAHAWLARGRGQHGEWARSTRERYERVVRRHIEASPEPHLPPLGSLRLTDLTVDHVAEWSAANERVLAPTTAVIALISLKAVCRFAVRRGWMDKNPALDLEPGEKPRWTPGRVGILEGAPLARVLDQSGSYRPLFELLAFTGLRIGEALGLTWADVDFERDVLRVHRQLSRYREHARLKTEAGRRQIVLAPAMDGCCVLAGSLVRTKDRTISSSRHPPVAVSITVRSGKRSAWLFVGQGSVRMVVCRSTVSATASPRC